MIVKNIIGVILAIFSILIILSIFNSVSKDINLNNQKNSFERFTETISFICKSHNEKLTKDLELRNLNGNFVIYKNSNNSLCIKFSSSEIKCERFNCNINFKTLNSSQSILSSKKEVSQRFYYCFIEKLNINNININCSERFDY